MSLLWSCASYTTIQPAAFDGYDPFESKEDRNVEDQVDKHSSPEPKVLETNAFCYKVASGPAPCALRRLGRQKAFKSRIQTVFCIPIVVIVAVQRISKSHNEGQKHHIKAKDREREGEAFRFSPAQNNIGKRMIAMVWKVSVGKNSMADECSCVRVHV